MKNVSLDELKGRAAFVETKIEVDILGSDTGRNGNI